MLSYSRGALLALLIGLAVWFAVVPLRLRGAVPLLAAGGVRTGGRLGVRARRSVSRPIPLAARAGCRDTSSVRCSLLMALALLAAGLAVEFLAASGRCRRAPAGMSAAGCWRPRPASPSPCARGSPAPGGIEGQTSKAWDQLTDPTRALRPTRRTG